MKLAIILGTRPEIIRLSQIIRKAKELFDLVLIHTGQNYDRNLNQIFFEQLGLPNPDYTLDTVGSNLGETLGKIISMTYNVLSRENPDALLILGDTNSSLSAISAKRLKIPIFHMEAGNRCFDQNVPEEINRVLVDSIADINLAYTENSRRYLISSGLHRDTVFVTGSPIPEVLKAYERLIDDDPVLESLKLERQKYLLVSVHREENLDIGDNLTKVFDSLQRVQETYQHRIIFTTHPRTKIKLKSEGIFDKLSENIQFIEPMGLPSYIKLMKNAFCTISDSGTISEEATYLNIPAVTIRNAIERPEAIENGNIIVAGLETNNLLLAIKMAIQLPQISKPIEYTVTDVSSRVLKIIVSYHHIVNRRTYDKKSSTLN